MLLLEAYLHCTISIGEDFEDFITVFVNTRGKEGVFWYFLRFV